MFLPALFIALGLAILLSTLGILNSTFWGIFWAAFFLIIGFSMLRRRGMCPMCGFGVWKGRMHDKFHAKFRGKSDDECCGHCDKEEEHTNPEE